MSTLKTRVFGSGIMLAMLLAAFAAFAQETDDDDMMPAVNTSAITADEPGATDAVESEQEVPILAPDITRSTSGSQVMDSIELGRTEITGNQELPKVLYIVPWQKPSPGDLVGKPVNTLLDEVLAPVDRGEFIRQVEYYEDLYGDGTK